MKVLGWSVAAMLLAAVGGCSSSTSTSSSTPPPAAAPKTSGGGLGGGVVLKTMPMQPKMPKASMTVKQPVARLAVQHGNDPDAAKVNQTPTKTDVDGIVEDREKAGGVDLAAEANNRVAPYETTTYQVDADIKKVRRERNGDIFLTIQGSSGAQAIVVVPDPALCKGSPFLVGISKAHDALDAKFHPDGKLKAVNQKATIVGIGYMGPEVVPARLVPGIGVSFPTGS